MWTVGLICEGPTDRVVLERVLAGLSGDRTRVNPVQPPDPMRAGVDFGGWEQVFASIDRQDVSGALAFNDFVVVQIDTDVCEQPRFGVSRREDGRELTEAELAARVRARLVSEIERADPEADLARVAFAVCVNELECWLLLHLSERTPKAHGCFDAANRELRKAGRQPLGGREKAVRAYEDAAKGLRKSGVVDGMSVRSDSLRAFVAEIRALLPPGE